MNKFGMILGVAAIAVVAGCKDPSYGRKSAPAGEPKSIDTQVETKPVTPVAETKPVVTEVKPAPVEPAPVVAEVKPLPPAEEEFTIYIVQRGDYLAKISKKYNVTINSIKRLNNMKGDVIRLGQKIKLPGKIDVGEQTVPKGAIAKEPAKKAASAKKAPAVSTSAKASAPATYDGPTTDYAVQSGDILGTIALKHGITVRQLKALNGLTSDALKIGQKLKVPAGAVAKTPVEKPLEPIPGKVPVVEAPVTEMPVKVDTPKVDAPVVDQPAQSAVVPAVPVETKPATPAESEASVQTYTVQEGESVLDVSIRFSVGAAAIRELNNMGENDKLTPGQIIKLPAGAMEQ